MPAAPIKAPPRRLLALELRALIEYEAYLAATPILRRLKHGDGHPVLVLPGWRVGDRFTRPIRSVLRSQGYWVHGWRLGSNDGPTPEILEGVERRLLELRERHGRSVSLVGLSLGGVYARDLARAHPEAVRQVITLASPFRYRPQDRTSLSWFVERFIKDVPQAPGPDIAEEDRPPLTVPSTAIYTRTDGIVRWHMCIQAAGSRRENVEVRGSHSGLAHNTAALIAISDRLAQPEDGWTPFRPPTGFALLFPTPASWRPPRTRREMPAAS
jgi:pimeloyl-ACP methyl ester carboxylesterase